MAHLLQGDSDISEHIAVQGKVSTQARLHIYRNAYQVRLKETLDTDHPVTGLYLGDELFELMVAAYREQHLSRHQSLRHYADALPEFLATQQPFCESPQIAELARFERLLLSAFDAREATRVSRENLQQLPLEAWPAMLPTFHPSVHLFESDWNVVSLWQALNSETVPPPAQQATQAWLLWRNGDLLTEFRHLNAVELCLFKQFLSGAGFAAACEALLELLPSAQVSGAAAATLLQWLDLGLIVALAQYTPVQERVRPGGAGLD
jgi:hypothetical protein